MRASIVIYGTVIFTVLCLYYVIHFMGTRMEPQIRHHEQEHAHCYSANKMLFVSIACIPKVSE